MKTKKQKVVIKPKFKSKMIVDLQYLVLKDTNAGLISRGIHFACRKFIDELRKIPLSEELQ